MFSYLKSYFCCDPNSMRILCGWKIYGDNCDLFLSSRDFKCKERNWEFTKVHEGRCDLHFRLLKRFQNCLAWTKVFAENMAWTFVFSFSFYLLIIFLYLSFFIKWRRSRCQELVYSLLGSFSPSRCTPCGLNSFEITFLLFVLF